MDSSRTHPGLPANAELAHGFDVAQTQMHMTGGGMVALVRLTARTATLQAPDAPITRHPFLMDPQQARDLAALLLQAADQAQAAMRQAQPGTH